MLTNPRVSKRRKTLSSSFFIIAVLFVVLFVFGRAVWNLYGRYEESNNRRAQAEEEYSTLSSRIKNMQAAVTSFETQEGREAVVRESFNLVKKGEQVVIILEAEKEVQKIEEKTSWYNRVWDKIRFWE